MTLQIDAVKRDGTMVVMTVKDRGATLDGYVTEFYIDRCDAPIRSVMSFKLAGKNRVGNNNQLRHAIDIATLHSQGYEFVGVRT